MDSAREIFADRLENAETRVLTDSRDHRKKYSSKNSDLTLLSVNVYYRIFYLIFVVVSSRDNASQDPQKSALVANYEFYPEGMQDLVALTRSVTVVTASKTKVRRHDEEKLSGNKSSLHLRLCHRLMA